MSLIFASNWRMYLVLYISILKVGTTCAQEDVLRSPLFGVNSHRSRVSAPDPDSNYYDLPHYRLSKNGEDYSQLDDSSYEPVDYSTNEQNRALEKLIMDYFNDKEKAPNQKRLSSSFRERNTEREKSKHQEKLAELFLQKLEEQSEDKDIDYDNGDYMDMIESLWEKYNKYSHAKDEPVYDMEPIETRKRQLAGDFSTLGWNGVGYRKRQDLDVANDNLYFLRYNEPVKDEYQSSDYGELNKLRQQDRYNQDYLYAKRKRFPVAKRSSNFYGTPVHHKHNSNGKELLQKRLAKGNDSASGTDPKIVKDLSNIFGTKKHNMTYAMMKAKKSYNKSPKHISTTSIPMITSQHDENQKEKITSIGRKQNEPIKIKKKSIDWSNYFGIDKREKKSDFTENKIDNDWLIKRYNKAVNSAVKRSSDYPLNIFRNHDEPSDVKKIEETNEVEKKRISPKEESKIGDMDDKLENVEDLIIDEALKYTGAHEGETDPKEVQEVKDKVISRLAAAYSLEKMRRALTEFKMSLAAQRYGLKGKENDGTGMKRNFLDISRWFQNDGKNQGDTDSCSAVIDRRCQSVIAGDHNALFYSLCKWHQFCYLCNPVNNEELLTSCDVMFLSKAELLCQGDVVCQWATRPAVDYLRDLHESSPMELAGQCDKTVCDSSYITSGIDHGNVFKARRR